VINAYQNGVIPQNFLFLREARERKFVRNPRFFRYPEIGLAARLWIPHKFPFAQKREEEFLRNDDSC